MRWSIRDPGHVALRRSIRTTVGVVLAMVMAMSLLKELKAWREDVDAELMKPNPDYDPSDDNSGKK